MNKLISILVLAIVCASCASSPSELKVPAGQNASVPSLFTDSNNAVFLSWIEKKDTITTMMLSEWKDGSWSQPSAIQSGHTWFVNWADYPMVGFNGDQSLALYLDKSGDGTYAYDVKYTMASNRTGPWTEPKVLHDDGKQAEHGFVSILPYQDHFLVTWLDGRNTVMEGMEHHEGHHGQMSLRAAELDKNGQKLNEWELDNRTCDCCQTAAAMTTKGPVVVYRDRSDDEIRDMSIVRFVDGNWTSPAPVSRDDWKIAGCPVNGPRVASNNDDLVVAWFSAAGDKARVKVIFSHDGGSTFGEPILISDQEVIGRVDVTMIDNQTAIVSWMEGSSIKLMRVSSDGKVGKPYQVATSSSSRSSGFPQMTPWKDQIILAWTDDKEKTIKSTVVSLKSVQ